MSRLPKVLLLFILIVFVLACNTINRPLNDAQNLAKTAEALATAMPVETLQSLATSLPVETIQAAASSIPDIGNMFDPQGTPVSEWNGIPIMPEATAGQEFTDPSPSYSFKINVTAQEVKDYYDAQMPDIGWTAPISIPVQADGGALAYSKDGKTLTVLITVQNDVAVVILTIV